MFRLKLSVHKYSVSQFNKDPINVPKQESILAQQGVMFQNLSKIEHFGD